MKRFVPVVLSFSLVQCTSKTTTPSVSTRSVRAEPSGHVSDSPPPFHFAWGGTQKKPFDHVRGPANYSETPDGLEYNIPKKREFPLNTSISPCSNFYEHVCSIEIKNFTLRPDRSYHAFTFSDARERILKSKKEFFKTIEKATFLTEHGVGLRNLYRACMNEEVARVHEASSVKKLVDQIVATRSHGELISRLHDFSEAGLGSFVDFDSAINLDDPRRWDVIVPPRIFSLPERDYYKNPELQSSYAKVMAVAFKSLGFDRADLRAQKAVELETQIGLLIPSSAEIRQRYIQKTEISPAQLIALYPALQLERMTRRWPKEVRVRNFLPEPLAYLNAIWNQTDLETLKDLAIYHTVSRLMDDGYPEFFKAEFDFQHRFLGGPERRSDRAERCVNFISENFSRELDAELLPRLFPSFPRDRFVKMSERIRASIVDGLRTNDWLSAEARQMATKKIQTAKLYLVEPSRPEDWGFNPKVTYSPTRHTWNQLSLARAKAQKLAKDLTAPRNQAEWLMSPLTINAYYISSDNAFVMPIGVLQPPLFDPERSDEENIASTGSVMAHELGHAIDDKGSNFDDRGQLVSWMNPTDLSIFKQRSAALVSQFDKAGHNGNLTLGENIADLVGLTFAYNAAFPDGKGSVEQKQKFFIAYAQTWCSTARPAFLEKLLKEDTHAMGWARTNEQVKHQGSFAEAFSCRAGDEMYLPPSERVRIW